MRQHGRQRGQSLSEYGIVIGLIGVVAIGGLVVLNGSITSGLQSTAKENTNPAPLTPVLASTASVTAPSGSLPSDTGADSLQMGASQTGLAFSETTSNLIETAGANGTTDLMANQITVLKQQLLAAGKIDAEQASFLDDLANKGHRIASLEKVIETAAANHDGNSTFLGGGSISFEGKTYPDTQSVLNLIGYDDGGKLFGAGNVTSDFESAYQKAVSSGALTDPAVSSQIEKLKTDISKLSDEMQMAGWSVDHGEINATQLTQEVAKQYPTETASGVTNTKSADICETGNGTDANNNCK